MFQRVAYGILAIVVLLLLVLQDVVIARESVRIAGPFGELLRRGSLIPLFFVIMLLRASRELTRILSNNSVPGGARPHAAFANLMIVFLLLAPWFSAAGWLGDGVAAQEGLIWQLTALMVTVLGTGLLAVLRRDPQGALRDMGATFLLVFYLGFLGSFGLLLRCGRDIPAQEGAWLLLIVILVTKASDIGAYFAGTALGRHKLIPSISPGKTVEGAIGGLLGSAGLASLIAAAPAWMAPVGPDQPWLLLAQDATRSFTITHDAADIAPLWRAFLLGLAVSAAGQIGDLVESCLKRDGGLKDSGSLIPTYGGVLDLIDSPIYAIPVAWLLLTAVWNVV
jgi:phosphatidate cytidylyltransferase